MYHVRYWQHCHEDRIIHFICLLPTKLLTSLALHTNTFWLAHTCMMVQGHKHRISKHARLIEKCGKASKTITKSKSLGLQKWIPFDIVASNILPRLLVKSLARFCCGCKQCCSFTCSCDPCFAMEQLKKAPKTESSTIICSVKCGEEKTPFYIFYGNNANGGAQGLLIRF